MKRVLMMAMVGVFLIGTGVQTGWAQTETEIEAKAPAPAPAITDSDLEVLRKDIARLNRSCGARLAQFTRERKAESLNVLYLSLAGLVAGAIIAPILTAANAAANAGWIAGFAGFAGATNTATGYMRSFGFSGEDAAASYASAVAQVDRLVSDALSGDKTLTERRLLLLLAEEKCRFIRSETDAPPATGGGS